MKYATEDEKEILWTILELDTFITILTMVTVVTVVAVVSVVAVVTVDHFSASCVASEFC